VLGPRASWGQGPQACVQATAAVVAAAAGKVLLAHSPLPVVESHIAAMSKLDSSGRDATHSKVLCAVVGLQHLGQLLHLRRLLERWWAGGLRWAWAGGCGSGRTGAHSCFSQPGSQTEHCRAGAATRLAAHQAFAVAAPAAKMGMDGRGGRWALCAHHQGDQLRLHATQGCRATSSTQGATRMHAPCERPTHSA